MPVTPGTRVGVYEVAALIGRGGMGEVCRARDTRLHRDVALKVLPDPFITDPERLVRFQREAQVLASLNHPHIGAIYGFEQVPSTGSGQADVHALVLELVEGPTLADRIAQGPIPLDEALAIARQMAEALEAAHEHNIVHRDLKPANVKLRPHGTVKVLDFGLAKAIEGDSQQASAAQSPTITAMATRAGVIIGTAAYMSPEQARGRTVDKRADIWAFGCVLYEMLAGKRAFTGDEVVDVLAAVIGKEPDWSALPASAPAGIRRLLRRCLVKDPKARLHDIGDARLEIDEALAAPLTGSVSGEQATQPRRRRYVGTMSLAFVLGGVVTTAALWLAMRPLVLQTAAPVTRLLVGVGPAEQLAGQEEGCPTHTAMALSPDGRSLVFSAVGGSERQLYLRRLDELEAKPIVGTERGGNPFFSPDGQWVGFWAAGELKKVPLSGGPPVTLCKTGVQFGASWGADDRIVFALGTGGLWQVSARGGTAEALTSLDTKQGEVSHRLPHVLPGGDAVLFTVTRNRFPKWDETQVVVYSRRTGSRKVLIEGGADARYVPTGHIVYVREGVLMAAPFDPVRLEVTGGSIGVEADLMQAAYHTTSGDDSGAAQYGISDTGALVYVPGGVFPAAERSLVWVDRTGRVEPVPIPPRAFTMPRLSPDGQRIAVATKGREMDIWLFDMPRRTFTRLTTAGRNGTPVWTPDGSRVVYRSGTVGPDNLFWRPADGSSGAERLSTSASNQTPASWSPDGQTLAFYDLLGSPDIWILPLGGNRQARPIVETPFFNAGADFSPDGRWLAYATNESGRGEVYVQPYPGPGARQQISTDGGMSPVWRRDGRELFYVVSAQQGTGAGPLKMMAVPIMTTPAFRAGEARPVFEGRYDRNFPARGYDVTADGQRFLMVQEKERPPTVVTEMVVVLNWFEELKRRVPAK